MRRRTALVAATLGGLGVNFALQKGLLDWFPNWAVYCLLCAPPVTGLYLGLTHDNVKNYVTSTNRRMALAMFIIIGALVGGMIGWGIYALQTRSVRISDSKGKESTVTHVNTFTPLEIAKQIGAVGPLQRDDVAKGFMNGVVDWTLFFGSVIPVKGDPNVLLVTFGSHDMPSGGIKVQVRAPREGNEYLGLIKGGDRAAFNVRGVISEIDVESQSGISLVESSFKRLSTRSERLTPAQREQLLSMLRHAAGQRVSVISVSQMQETLDFTKHLKAALENAGLIIASEGTETKLLRGYQNVRIVVPWLPTSHPFVGNLPDMLEKALEKIGIFPQIWKDSGAPIPSPQEVTILIE